MAEDSVGVLDRVSYPAGMRAFAQERGLVLITIDYDGQYTETGRTIVQLPLSREVADNLRVLARDFLRTGRPEIIGCALKPHSPETPSPEASASALPSAPARASPERTS